ncbi:MAG: hypothetical protein IRZ33_06190 [Alicyclobacillaceae bacterium]|nr:hypothetical protein [Alicyclobacillaceae bacterium]
MAVTQTARCPYCGETWEMEVGTDTLTDEQFLELTREPVTYIPCEDCMYLQFD